MKKTVSTIIMLAVVAFTAIAQQFENESNFTVSTARNGEAVTITGYNGSNTIVNIPPRINNLPVTVISEEAFRDKGLTSVTIPSGVRAIGVRAFSSNRLTSVTIPDSVTFLDIGAFANNTLTSVVISNNVTAIGNSVFFNNTITNVVIPNSVTSIGVGAFARNHLTSVVIPNSVTSIREGAFQDNRLTSVTIPNSVTVIERGAFLRNRLTSVTMPDSVTSIGDEAFLENPLTQVTIGANFDVLSLGHNAFVDGFHQIYHNTDRRSGVYYLENDFVAFVTNNGRSLEIVGYNGTSRAITIPARIMGLPVTSIERGVFAVANYIANSEEKKITSVIIPNGVITIGEYAFSNNALTSLTIPNSVTSIGNNAFSYNQLTSITIPNTVTTIEVSVFYHNQLTSVTISNGVTSIKGSAFSSNPRLTSITIPNSVTSIARGAFDHHIRNITIGANVNLELDIVVHDTGFGVQLEYRFGAIGSESSDHILFNDFYNSNGRRAGTYIFGNGRWSRQ